MGETYRILVTGSRLWDDGLFVAATLGDAVPGRARDVVVVHGMCDPRDPETGQMIPWAAAEKLPLKEQLRLASADWLADRWAVMHGATPERHPADWKRFGKAAGFRRNAEMIPLRIDLCLAFIKDNSRGTTHCMGLAEKAGIPVQRFDYWSISEEPVWPDGMYSP
jgi:hypothetical protein